MSARQRLFDFDRASFDWAWEMDDRACVTKVSGRFTALLNRLPGDIVGQPVERIGALKPDRDGVVPMAAARLRDEAFRSQLFVVKDAAGKDHAFELSGTPVVDASGRLVGYSGGAVEVAPEAEPAPAVAVPSDAGASPSRQAFLTNVSHELRTPLNAIIGFAEAMRMEMFGRLGERYRDYCGDIVDAGQHLLGLIDDMLDASELDSGEVDIAVQEVRLTDVVAEARALVAAQAGKAGVAISEVKVPPRLRVRADRRRLKQILVNLLANAVKFTLPGGKVGIEAVPDDISLSITVWDQGIGIAAERHEAIFARFARLGGDDYTHNGDGIGLGLHIARELARRMDGDLTVASAPGDGSRFTLTLPAAG